MGRYKEAPWDFDCPYQHKCPYLGISVKYACYLLSDYEKGDFRNGHYCIEARAEIKAKDEYIEKLETEIAELRAKHRQEHQSKFKPNAGRAPKRERDDPAEEQSGAKPSKKRGAPVGHPPWNREKPEHIDRSLTVPAPEVCPHCSAMGLTPSRRSMSRYRRILFFSRKQL